jgi:hypothetical protein
MSRIGRWIYRLSVVPTLVVALGACQQAKSRCVAEFRCDG